MLGVKGAAVKPSRPGSDAWVDRQTAIWTPLAAELRAGVDRPFSAPERLPEPRVRVLARLTRWWAGRAERAAERHAQRHPDPFHCRVCGTAISDPLSVARGVGPVCWERGLR